MILESSQAYPIRWVSFTCQHCFEGAVPKDRADFKDWLVNEFPEKDPKRWPRFWRAKWGLEQYRRWKEDGVVTCPECMGQWKWSEPR